MADANNAGTWAPDEARRFFRAYQKYGSDFFKVSKMVGGGKSPEVCAALWRLHQEYFNLKADYVTEQQFLAEVQDNGVTRRAILDRAYGRDRAAEAAPVVDNGAADEAYGLSDLDRNDGNTGEDELDEAGPLDDDVSYLEANAAAAVVAMASPGKPDHSARGEGSMSLQDRARRPPKRASSISPGKRTPSSAAKRVRAKRHGAADDGDIYEYYDEGKVSITESARKRRKAQARLEFGEEPQRNPVPRRREAADEKGGVMALLSLAEAGSEEDAKEALGGDGVGGIPYSDDMGDDMGDIDEDEYEDHEEDVLGVMMDDDRDEDYRTRGGRNRRAKSNRNRPRATHVNTTPRRMAQRIVGSGLGSPGWTLGLGGHDVDLLGDLEGDPPPYLASPGLPPQLPPGFVASPKNPMPRLRPRKRTFEHKTLVPHIKSIFGRRPHFGSSTLVSLGSIGGLNPTVLDGDAKLSGSPTERHVHRVFGSRLRRWAIFEFFYSAIDRPWFMNETMTELLAHMGLPEKASLTRKEWTVLRSSLGRPRRLSWAFLRDCRAKLEAHRAMARAAYGADVPDSNALALLPRPIVVGQRVVARHPATRQLHDGSVLTVTPDSYRIQFDRRELGVEVVRDVDVMPSEPWANLPLAMLAARPKMVIGGKLIVSGRPVKLNNGVGSVNAQGTAQGPNGGALGTAASQRLPPIDSAMMAELATNLDRKEALLVQLRQMNDEAGMGVHIDPTTGTPKAAFLQSYSSVILKLKEVNESVLNKIAELERAPNGTADWVQDLTGPMEGARLPAELQNSPITAQTLAAAALNEARRVCTDCKSRLSHSMASRAVIQGVLRAQAHQDAVAWANPTGPAVPALDGAPSLPATSIPVPNDTWIGALEPIIEGAVWTLSLLQQGADRLVPAPALAMALDSSILSVKPKSVANAALYTEIETALKHLKLQLLA